MKAIYIPNLFDPTKDLEKLNNDLKDCHSILLDKSINNGFSLPGGMIGPMGHLLILDNHTRKDKLEKINNINETTNNNLLPDVRNMLWAGNKKCLDFS